MIDVVRHQIPDDALDEKVATVLRREIGYIEELIAQMYREKPEQEREKVEMLMKSVSHAAYAVIAQRVEGYDDKQEVFDLTEMLKYAGEKANLRELPQKTAELLFSIGLLGLMQDEMSHEVAVKTVREKNLGKGI